MTAREEVTGIILAGGMSSRFGSNKALSRIDGDRLIERLCRTVGSVTGRMMLITHTPEDYAFLKLESRKDLVPRCGPIGGIYTALRTAQTPLCLCVACDMPFVRPEFLEYMVERSAGYDVVVPVNDGRVEPLCAVYRETCVPAIEDRIHARRFKIAGFFDEVRVLRLAPEEGGFHDDDMFFNINDRTDYDEALKRMTDQAR
ncbi:MAG: molybdenum cofactor guanylyltransferase [Gemmatimonadetes bacterium]|nr:molybdenum cofactor guanylyltransferase [Gemmatimonadota bacterium]MYA77112.1 molybdenum cofactor guanylyltransferase [Gemmatimonadota bacterium]MYG16650.1 molybdenum cofactor guanylyltransferase [Gemmatimonadota bacterium]MYH19437.1 molybdenum cofactor guanylyltransferase [Gemmatimonadota bacterium]MYK98883.1 molybdenum cofactor guanylyltransferase [Gemmatimonadota bacterium]